MPNTMYVVIVFSWTYSPKNGDITLEQISRWIKWIVIVFVGKEFSVSSTALGTERVLCVCMRIFLSLSLSLYMHTYIHPIYIQYILYMNYFISNKYLSSFN